MINDKELKFLEKRKKMVRTWPFVGVSLIVAIIGFLVWLYFRVPFLINPYAIVARQNAKNIDQNIIGLLALMLPIVFLTLFFVLFCFILIAFAFISNEKKYIRMIDALQERKEKEEY